MKKGGYSPMTAPILAAAGGRALHQACRSAPQAAQTYTAAMPSFEQQVAELRDYLLKFARLQLRNPAWAEDAVSETVLAALAKPQAFGNRSQLKTWLVGILKHKVVDALRHHSREISGLQADDDADTDTDPLEIMAFKADGHYMEAPADWGNPEEQMRSRQFFEVLEASASPGTAVFDARMAGDVVRRDL